MSGPDELQRQAELRLRAVTRLKADADHEASQRAATAALGVLHTLAASPATAPGALAVLHELQVHQVELELQHEELCRANVELERDLARQAQLYELAPVGLVTIDRSSTVLELNQAGARLLGRERDALPGTALVSRLTPRSGEALTQVLVRLRTGEAGHVCAVELTRPDGTTQVVQAHIDADPAGDRFLVALIAQRGADAKT